MSDKNVLRVSQSPMNAKQWCCDLECGHEKWITAARKPKVKKLNCERCKQSS